MRAILYGSRVSRRGSLNALGGIYGSNNGQRRKNQLIINVQWFEWPSDTNHREIIEAMNFHSELWHTNNREMSLYSKKCTRMISFGAGGIWLGLKIKQRNYFKLMWTWITTYRNKLMDDESSRSNVGLM